MSIRERRRRRLGIRFLFVLIAVALGTSGLTAQPDRAILVDEWCDQVWVSAIGGRGTPERVFEQWSRVPEQHVHKGIRDFRLDLDRYLANLDEQTLDEASPLVRSNRDTALQNRVRTLLKHIDKFEIPEDSNPNSAQISL